MSIDRIKEGFARLNRRPETRKQLETRARQQRELERLVKNQPQREALDITQQTDREAAELNSLVESTSNLGSVRLDDETMEEIVNMRLPHRTQLDRGDMYMKRGPRLKYDMSQTWIGNLFVMHVDAHDKHGHAIWKCRCRCGLIAYRRTNALVKTIAAQCNQPEHNLRLEQLKRKQEAEGDVEGAPASTTQGVNQ